MPPPPGKRPCGRFFVSTLLSAALLSLSLLVGCDGARYPTSTIADDLPVSASRVPMAPIPPAPPTLRADLPSYPVPVLYIVYREFVIKHPQVKSFTPDNLHYQAYVERRLRELYPDRGYPGMMKDAAQARAEYQRDWALHDQKIRQHQVEIGTSDTGCEPIYMTALHSVQCGPVPPPSDPSWDGQEEHAGYAEGYIPTIAEEADSLQATSPEVERLSYYESLADGSYYDGGGGPGGGGEPIYMHGTGLSAASIDDLIRLAGEGITPLDDPLAAQWLGAVLVHLVAPVGLVAGYFYWRIETAGNRAERYAQFYFPGAQHNTRADAYRHIFLSMQLRRYVSEYIALWITTEYENRYPNRYPERRMDIHNNSLGRRVQYNHFRGHWFWDRWDWQKWAQRIRSYIADSANAEFIPQWAPDQPPLSDSEVAHRASLVPNWKYIYIATD